MTSDILSIHSVHRIDLAVPNLDLARDFYTAFGLEVGEQQDGLAVRVCGAAHDVLTLRQGQRKKLLRLVLGVFETDIPGFRQILSRNGVVLSETSQGALLFNDPDGLPIELVIAPKSSPDEAQFAPPRLQAPTRSQAPKVSPSGLSHLLLFTKDVPCAIEFYSRMLGLRLSDRSGDEIAFLHSPHGSDHHLIAFVRSEGPGLHHSSWRVDSLDAVGLGAMQMAACGFEQGWGLGRHVLGSNYFHYVRDPWGGYAEYSFDMDYIPAGDEWPSANHDGEDAFYVWGPSPPPDFAANTEIE